uniref:7SK snRNA methylphosphate capping enzyme-like n=1 Tax=Scatophagus argus TaxID=75038 RepID=UPI001ED7FF1E|nr:7SK snRNA methylphosphate capping enzyme-like [Scatophagus argus]XP_046265939.1 7SK snRNA methylphosphate capping enzyme-like [Scatophagus argus]XP_046265940.1 7SK snRNA methylphosphate capping enzyme-like [Scatophagus argus]XP_046265941.1 7SK snRNA methylphosphate capping enzyme-like [Scatophagus argus]XP_046265942.1 7SK snRNA methylphosphate capping enzyme-like [Scatophagus argus]XP_046265943.1 7SK snRNA methylphosphate capping enzyme-like [Scatophagus argus]
MSADEDSIKTGSPQASSTSSLQLSECSGGYSTISVMVDGTAATPEFAAACPVPGTAASPKHTSTIDTLTNSDDSGQRARGNENTIGRRNSFHHSKQQQQTKLTKRRNTANSSFKHPASGKRRRRANSESDSVLPTNFLLGGNIFDPLNLNSLLDEDVNRALNAETPKSSPLPAKSRDPVEILIPRDITDPLNLNSGIADSSFLVSPFKSGGRRRHRNRHHGGGGCGGGVGGVSGISAAQSNLSDSAKNEVKTSTSALVPGMLASCSVLDVSKESNSFSSVTGDSHVHSADNSASCKEEMASVTMEDSTSTVSGGPNQHTSRRKRRRNSGKMDPPVTHSTPLGKSGSGDRSCGAGGQRNSQLFQTPRSGPKTGPGGRQHQQPHNQAKEQQKKKFQYGNYNKYYGYRNPSNSEDPRIRLLRPEWFEGKDVLDLGCNSGHLTLYIAKMLRPARILGLDIDSGLVHAARKNIRHYLSELQTQEARRAMQSTKQEERNGNESHTGADKKHNEAESRDENGKPVKGESGPAETVNDNDSCHTDETGTQRQDSRTEEMEQGDCDLPPADHSVSCSFPVSLRISRGPIAAPPLTETSTTRPGEFPSNVSFIKANYVLENDNLLSTQRPEYDVIMCLSVTKWVHLNWGDNGLKRLFKRVYRHLRPGGMFILEPQPWESYVRRRKLTDCISRNYHSIRLKPDQFSSYLTTEVGFSSFEYLGAPKCSVRGFQRPIYLFHK